MTEPNPMQDAYDAFFRAAEQLALVALFDVASEVRAVHPDAVAMRIDWSDQGDYLSPSATPLDADGDELDDYVDTDNASALDESNRSTWEAYTGVDGSRAARREAEASGYVFPLDPILTDLAPKPSRTYLVGLPVAVTVDDDGRVTYDIDTAEAGLAVKREAEVPEDVTDDQHAADVAAIDRHHEAHHPCPECGSPAGQPCEPMCTGKAAHEDDLEGALS